MATLLELIVCVFAFRNALHRRLPFMTAYLLLVVTRDLLWLPVIRTFGYTSAAAFDFAWTAQGILLCARGLAIAELCLFVLQPYRGVWGVARHLLLLVAGILVLFAAIGAPQSGSWVAPVILRGERGLELTAITVLVLLLALCRYYGIHLDPAIKLLMLGLGFYSGVQVVNNAFTAEWLSRYLGPWNAVRSSSFVVSLSMWAFALRRTLPAARRAPALVGQQVYDELTPQVNARLRLLNQRLLEILRP